jgi:uncharacterized RDD family membrane protein YckC
MKCPKCQYIGFEQGDRCRNCGYDFSLTPRPVEIDLPIKTGDEAIGPFADFALADDEPARPVEAAPASRDATVGRGELPLFRERLLDDDVPLVSLPAAPRAPVSVRKSAPARRTSQAADADEPIFDLEPAQAPMIRRPASEVTPRQPGDEEAGSIRAAPAGARLLGAVIDFLLVASIDIAVVYLTLRLCGLRFDEIRALPVVPLAAFLAMLNGGYMAAFTAAGGQSIGKMAAGTRVVAVDESGAMLGVPLGQSIVRAAAYVVSVLPAGVGLLPALFGSDGRALHDRLAQTRVVRA